MQNFINYNDLGKKFKWLIAIYITISILIISASYFYWSVAEEQENFHIYNQEADIIVDKFREILDNVSIQARFLTELIRNQDIADDKKIGELLKYFRNKILIKYSLFYIHEISWISKDNHILKINEKNQLVKEKLILPDVDKNYTEFYLDQSYKNPGKLFLSDYKNIISRDNNLLETSFGVTDKEGKILGVFNIELSIPNIQASLEASQKHSNIKFLLLTRNLKVIMDSTSTYNSYKNMENYSSKLDFLYKNADEDFIRPSLFYKDVKYEYFQNNHNYNYIVLLGTKNEWFNSRILDFLYNYYIEFLLMLAFFVFVNNYFYKKYRKPIKEISDFSYEVFNGKNVMSGKLKLYTEYIPILRILIKAKNIIRKQNNYLDQIKSLIKLNTALSDRYKNITQYVFHDVKSPLTGALGKIEILVKEIVGPLGNKEYVNYSNEVKSNIETAMESLDRLFEFDNLNNINFYITKKSVRLKRVIDDLLKNYIDIPKINIKSNNLDKIGIYCEERILHFLINSIINYYIEIRPNLSQIYIDMQIEETSFNMKFLPELNVEKNIVSYKNNNNSQIDLIKKLVTVVFEGEFEIVSKDNEEFMIIKFATKLVDMSEWNS